MRNKKAQSGFILRVFSIMTYLIVLIIVLLLLNLSGCNPSNEVKKTINSYSPEILQLRADEQLVAYLRTPIPDDIIARIDWAKDESEGQPEWGGQPSEDDLNNAKSFLETYPNVYRDKLYAEFLTNLYGYGNSDDDDVKDKAKKAFDVVTKLTFLQKVEEHRDFLGKTLEIKEIYFSPRISVEYPDPDGWEWRSDKADPISMAWDDEIDGREPVAKAAIPLSGAKIVHVSFILPARKIYMRLPTLER